jgi:hypothetical protein
MQATRGTKKMGPDIIVSVPKTDLKAGGKLNRGGAAIMIPNPETGNQNV